MFGCLDVISSDESRTHVFIFQQTVTSFSYCDFNYALYLQLLCLDSVVGWSSIARKHDDVVF